MRNAFRPIPPLSDTQIRNLWNLIDKRGPTECWPWKGSTTKGMRSKNRGVYGYWSVILDGEKVVLRPHRVVYVLTHGEIPERHTLDHVQDRCTTGGLCCNPGHLEPCTQQENQRRYYATRDRCRRGHPVEPMSGTCPRCVRESTAAWMERNREQQLNYRREWYAANKEKIQARRREAAARKRTAAALKETA